MQFYLTNLNLYQKKIFKIVQWVWIKIFKERDIIKSLQFIQSNEKDQI